LPGLLLRRRAGASRDAMRGNIGNIFQLVKEKNSAHQQGEDNISLRTKPERLRQEKGPRRFERPGLWFTWTV